MKLNDVIVLNIDGLRENFNISELWDNIEMETFQVFESGLAKKNAPQAKEIVQLLVDRNNGSAEMEALTQNGTLNADALFKRFLPFHNDSLLSDQSDFLSRNQAILAELSLPLRDTCTNRQAANLYLFLLIHLQVFPKKVIPQASVNFYKKTISPSATGNGNEIASCPNGTEAELPHSITKEAFPYLPRLCIRNSKAMYLENDRLLTHPDKQPAIASQEKILSFAYTASLGLIAVTCDGRLSAGSLSDIRNRVSNQDKILMVSAYGECYMLLTASGGIITNIAMRNQKEWTDLCWVSVGLNSAVGIKRKWRSVVQIGSDPVLTDYSEVKTLYTYSLDGTRRFALLRTDGTLLTDTGLTVRDVLAANLSESSYEYALSDRVCVQKYNHPAHSTQTTKLPAGFTVSELQSNRTQLICGCFTAHKQSKILIVDKH